MHFKGYFICGKNGSNLNRVIFVIKQYCSSENCISSGYTDVIDMITWSHEHVPGLKDLALCTLNYSSINCTCSKSNFYGF